MNGERAKRFPLGLEDLVREPRKSVGRPGDARSVTPQAALSDARAAKSQLPALHERGAKPQGLVSTDTRGAKPQGSALTDTRGAKPQGSTLTDARGAKPQGPAAPTAARAAKPQGSATIDARSAKPQGLASTGARDAKPQGPAPTGVQSAKPKASSLTDARVAKPQRPSLADSRTLQPKAAASTTVRSAKPPISISPDARASSVRQPRASAASAGPRSDSARQPALRLPAAPLERTGAPGVPLTRAHALTSERVRERMVERLRANGVTDPRVLNAMATVPRHMFVDPGLATQAYEDAALPIGHHQTISKPSVVARMIELAAAGRTLGNVLEIGTGCGYQAAVLSQVARDVYSIERIKPLYERAKTNLRPLRIPNLRLHYGDGRLGLPKAAPFDAIVIAAAGLDVPQALLEQLAIGARLIAPVGTHDGQTQVLTLVERTGPAQWRESRLDRVFFVPLKSGVI
jgi:protein-L-isoaspartate(D-aspartate) O-methyltransferase